LGDLGGAVLGSLSLHDALPICPDRAADRPRFGESPAVRSWSSRTNTFANSRWCDERTKLISRRGRVNVHVLMLPFPKRISAVGRYIRPVSGSFLVHHAARIARAARSADSIAASIPRLATARCSPQKWRRPCGVPIAEASS